MQAEPLQQHDEWDATPLYYAAYAGNKDLVSYLLSTGAKCEEKVCAVCCTIAIIPTIDLFNCAPTHICLPAVQLACGYMLVTGIS